MVVAWEGTTLTDRVTWTEYRGNKKEVCHVLHMKGRTLGIDNDTNRREGERLGLYREFSGISSDMPVTPFAARHSHYPLPDIQHHGR